MRSKLSVTIFGTFLIFSIIMNTTEGGTKELIMSETVNLFERLQPIVTSQMRRNDRIAGIFTECVGKQPSTQSFQKKRKPEEKSAGPSTQPLPPTKRGKVTATRDGPVLYPGNMQVSGHITQPAASDYEKIKECAEKTYIKNIGAPLKTQLERRPREIIRDTQKSLFRYFWLHKNALLDRGVLAKDIPLFDRLSNEFKNIGYWIDTGVWPIAILEMEDFLEKYNILLNRAHGNLRLPFFQCISYSRLLEPDTNDYTDGARTALMRDCINSTFDQLPHDSLYTMISDNKRRINFTTAQKIYDMFLVFHRNISLHGMLAFYPQNFGSIKNAFHIELYRKYPRKLPANIYQLGSYQRKYTSLSDFY